MKSKPRYSKEIVSLLVFLLTVGLGVIFLIESLRTPSEHEIEKTLWLIIASALLPAGVLWTIEHYFLVKPLEDEYEILRKKLEETIEDTETLKSMRTHGMRAISTERAPLVKKVLETSLDDSTISEVVIVGSTQDGLVRRARWFEQFVKNSLVRNKKVKMMFTHWEYVTHRERQEDRPDGAIAQELRNSISKVLQWGVPKDCIRLAYGAPTVFMVIAGNDMILNPYPFGGESVTSSAIWLKKSESDPPSGAPGSIWREYYINHYDKPWNPNKPEYQRMNNKDPMEISYPLPEDWAAQLDLFIEDIVRKRILECNSDNENIE
jgi:hypothetical protein